MQPVRLGLDGTPSHRWNCWRLPLRPGGWAFRLKWLNGLLLSGEINTK